MAGIYIHIPFCKQACTYCNFHFSTSLKLKDRLLEAIHREIELKADLLKKERISTIYLGGGTPSLLTGNEINGLFDQIGKYADLNNLEEVTLEANPDDLTLSKAKELRATPVNRLSIGLQSFHESDLRLMNRAHNGLQAWECLDIVLDHGFEQLSVDLIYGVPGSSLERWAENLDIIRSYPVHHLSCYALTIEPKTAMEYNIRMGKQDPPLDAEAEEQFRYLMRFAAENQFDHYEISNFAKNGAIAKHNTSYWQGSPYIGLGPSAHSFDLVKRSWNIANNMKYISSIEAGEIPGTFEILTEADRFNEWIMTGLRTKWGISEADLSEFDTRFQKHFEKLLEAHAQGSRLIKEGDSWVLSEDGKLFADQISADLFFTED